MPWSGHLRNEIIMSGCRRKAADKSVPIPQTRFRGAFIKIILRLPELFLIFNYRLGSLMVDVQLISAMRADNDAFRDNLLHRDGYEPLALRAGKSGWSPTGTAGNILQIFKLQFCIQSFFVFHSCILPCVKHATPVRDVFSLPYSGRLVLGKIEAERDVLMFQLPHD